MFEVGICVFVIVWGFGLGIKFVVEFSMVVCVMDWYFMLVIFVGIEVFEECVIDGCDIVFLLFGEL